jgi:hypothetical protein
MQKHVPPSFLPAEFRQQRLQPRIGAERVPEFAKPTTLSHSRLLYQAMRDFRREQPLDFLAQSARAH